MLTKISKNKKRGFSHERIRKKLQGTSERPRLNVYRSLNHIYVQVIDDLNGKTLVSASTAEGTKEARRAGGELRGFCADKSCEIICAACPRVSPAGTGILLRARTCFCLSLGGSFLQLAERSTSRQASGRWAATKRSADATAAARLVARLSNDAELC